MTADTRKMLRATFSAVFHIIQKFFQSAFVDFFGTFRGEAIQKRLNTRLIPFLFTAYPHLEVHQIC